MDILKIPTLGVGVSLRPQFKNEIFIHHDKIDFIEIIADHYIDATREKMLELEVLMNHFIVIPHAINLSLGSASSLNLTYLEKLASLINFIKPPYWSEHISYNTGHETEIGHLAPLPFNDDFLNVLIKNIEKAKSYIPYPLVLENISYLVNFEHDMEEADFIRSLVNASGCGILLDLTNLHYNSLNHAYSVKDFINKIPLTNIVQIHFTGGSKQGDYYIDNHSSPTPEAVWNIMEDLFKSVKVKAAILERDDSKVKFEEIVSDVERARATGKKYGLWD
jgi:uncharacterized protein